MERVIVARVSESTRRWKQAECVLREARSYNVVAEEMFATEHSGYRRENMELHPKKNFERANSICAGQRLFARLMKFALLVIVSITLGLAQSGPSKQSAGMTVEGSVRDAAGKLVEGALVRLERRDSAGVSQTATNAEGKFEFVSVAGGTYAVSAKKFGFRSAIASVVVSSTGSEDNDSVVKVDLVLSDSGVVADSAKSTVTPVQEMQFADQPDFKIAGVTDWTAAGGHGSDSILRTSEALTRQTLALKPDLKAAGGSNVAADERASENALQLALNKDQQGFSANHNLGAFYLHEGRYRESIPLLEAAYKSDPHSSDNEYDLALACAGIGDVVQSREHVRDLLTYHATGDVHRLAAELDEKLGDPLGAVWEFQQAVSEDPSEQNYFEWGSELLLHRAIWQAKEVLTKGANNYPKSARMMTALGAALFAAALYDEAAQRLCDASDLNPLDSEPYIFMGKVEIAAPNPEACIEQRLARWFQQEPGNALSNYYYAMAVWKQHAPNQDEQVVRQVEGLLQKSVEIDPHLGEAYLQLGILSASQGKYEPAIDCYSRAITADSQLIEAHYRLGVAYDRVGEKEKAKQELRMHDELATKQAAEVERQRREVKQFVIAAPATASPR